MWRLATQDAEWSPADPIELRGGSIDDAVIDEGGELRFEALGWLPAGRRTPPRREAQDDLPSWELITPGGLVLELGPSVRWQISPC